MKNIISIIILTFIFSQIYSQNYFELIIGEENNSEGAHGIIQCNDNSFILSGTKQDQTDGGADSYLTKVSERGELLKEKIVSIQDTSIASFDILTLEDNKHLVLSILKSIENYDKDNYIIFTQIDDNLNTISENRIKFPIDTISIYRINFTQANENEMVCYGNCRKENKGYDWVNFMFKVSLTGDSLLFNTLPSPYSIMDLKIYNSEKLYYLSPNSIGEISVLNYSDFSLDTLVNISNSIDGHCFYTYPSIEFLSDTTFAIANNCALELDETTTTSIIVYDTACNAIDYNISLGIDDFEGQAPEDDRLDVNENNEILTAIWYGDTYFCVIKLDIDLNIIWEKYHFVPEYAIMWLVVRATSDGGAILLGLDYSNDIDIIVIKTDENGNITHVNGEPAEQKGHEIILYPNPGSTELTIQKAVQAGDCEFYLYNTTGKLILQQSLSSQTTEINTQALETGIYIYKIISENQVIETGKWVKE